MNKYRERVCGRGPFPLAWTENKKSRNIDVDYILDLEMRSENISISFSFHPLGNLFRPFSFHQKKKTMKLFLMTVTFSFSSFCPAIVMCTTHRRNGCL
jgi:hypothetical protein